MNSTLIEPIAQQTPADLAASVIVYGINQQLSLRIETVQKLWGDLWENSQASASDIFAALGHRGALVLQAGYLAVQDLQVCAATINTTAADLLGDAKYLTTKVPVSIGGDGTVTVQMP